MFTAGLAESDMEVVTLQGVEPDMIHRLIEYAYTGTTQLQWCGSMTFGVDPDPRIHAKFFITF
jgi:hypothetical protein